MAGIISNWSLRKILGFKGNARLLSFRLFTQRLNNIVTNYNGKVVSLNCLFFLSTDTICYVKIDHKARKYGTSNYTISSLLSFWLDIVFNHSEMPLVLVSYFGFLLFFIAILCFIYILIATLNGEIRCFSYEMLIILFSCYLSIILLSISILCRYVVEILHTINHDQEKNSC